MQIVVRIGLLCLALGLSALPARADEFTAAQRAEIIQILREALKQDPSILRDAVNAMQADETDRQKAALAAVKDKLIDPADPVGGNPKGDVTIVEFFDTRCPYCRKLDPTMAELLARDRGVRLVYKDLPILGPASVLGSKALLAANRQGGYEKLRELVMGAPPDLTRPMLQDLVRSAGLDWNRLERDMDDPAIEARIDSNRKLAQSIGIEGTPALVIGSELIPGAVEIADLFKAVANARGAK
ncbi:MAG: DsbA family protein [Acetobacteraceae bacterium]